MLRYLSLIGCFVFTITVPVWGASYVLDDQSIWKSYSSDLTSKISALDDLQVTELPMPVLFGITPDKVVGNFGELRSSGRRHIGQDIMSPKGTPIVSPTDAVVIRMGLGSSAGYFVYTANPGGETFIYMHLDTIADIKAGDVLKPGDLIGYVGNTGNASGGSPHLHFEIHTKDGPTEPLPRLTRVFPLADKIKYLQEILQETTDKKLFAERMVALFHTEFTQALSLEMTLPTEIRDAMKLPATALATVTPTTNTPSVTTRVTTGSNLTLGSRGLPVVALQKYLISKKVGSASRMVADGSFGPMTKKALAEFQASVGITPAIGIYGPITRAYVQAHP